MSDVSIMIVVHMDHSVTSLAPWAYVPDGDGNGSLRLCLTTGKTGSPGVYPGYIPRDGALPNIELSVDLEGGGDYEQLLSTSFQVADQMSDGQLMSGWLRSVGASLQGAVALIYVPAASVLPQQPPLWCGVVRRTQLLDTRIIVFCENDLDSDPVGEIVSDSSIRPIVYGNGMRVKLPDHSDTGDTVIEDLVLCRRLPWSQAPYSSGTSDFGYSSIGAVNVHKQINYEWVVQIHAGMRQTPANFAEYFPNGIVGSPDWYVEIVDGKGAGSSRRIKEGSAVTSFAGSLPAPDYRGFSCKKVNGANGGMGDLLHAQFEQQHYVQFVLDSPFTNDGDACIHPHDSGTYGDTSSPTYDDPKTTSLVPIDKDRWNVVFSYAFELPNSDRSYVRIVRRRRVKSTPIIEDASGGMPLYVKSGENWIRAHNAEELYRLNGANSTMLLIPAAGDANAWEIFQIIPFDPTRYCVISSPWPVGPDSIAELFGPGSPTGFGGTLTKSFKSIQSEDVWWMPQWDTQSHFSLMVGIEPESLANWDRVWLAAKFDAQTDQNLTDGAIAWGLSIFTSAASEVWFGETLHHTPGTEIYFGDGLPRTIRQDGYVTLWQSPLSVNFIPPNMEGGSDMYWRNRAVWIATGDAARSIVAISLFVGAPRRSIYTSYDIWIKRLSLLASRRESISDIYLDVPGPRFETGTAWSDRLLQTGLGSGIDSASIIYDHAHAIEDLFRRYLTPTLNLDPVDAASVEQATEDLWRKTQTTLTLLPEESRPRISVALTEAAPQVGSVCSQFCRDGMLVGSRSGDGRIVLKAFLARSRLEEQDAIISEDDMYYQSISEAPTSPLSKLCTAPLIRYCQQGGAPTRYIQILRPDAESWLPEYTIGFPDDTTAMRAWNICHRGWLESRVVHAREVRMDSVPDIESLIPLIMQPRGTTYLDWISRPKIRLQPMVGIEHPAANLPRGSRVKLSQWRYAPAGAWGTVESISINLDKPVQSRFSRLTLVMDLEP